MARYSTAKGYLQSCKIITQADPRGPGSPDTILGSSMLAAFALELYFKAWLLGSGRASSEVRSFGHRMGDLYEACLSASLPRVTRLSDLVGLFAGPHQDFTFRYISPRDEIVIPNWPVAYGVFEELDAEVDRLIGASASFGLEPGH